MPKSEIPNFEGRLGARRFQVRRVTPMRGDSRRAEDCPPYLERRIVVEAVVPNRLNLVGRPPRRTPRRSTERSRGDASDVDGQAGGRASGSERVKRPTSYSPYGASRSVSVSV